MKRAAGICLLLLQIVSVVYARFVPSRWLAWAPNDYAVGYKIQVKMNGHELSADEVANRYRVPAEGVYENPAQNMIDIISQRERTYGRDDQSNVVLTYRPNGGPAQEWRWPER